MSNESVVLTPIMIKDSADDSACAETAPDPVDHYALRCYLSALSEKLKKRGRDKSPLSDWSRGQFVPDSSFQPPPSGENLKLYNPVPWL